MKICSKCSIKKELNHFNKMSSSKDGYRSNCRTCQKNSYILKRDHYIFKMKENRIKKLDEYIQRDKLYYNKNKEKILNQKKQYHINNKIKILKKAKNYYYNNKEKRKIYHKNWTIKNNICLKEYRKEQSKKYRKKYPHIVLWRSILSYTLKRLNRKKYDKTINILGYSAIELKKNIESKFVDGMTWNNYGEWQIDHIIPISKFDSTTPISIVNALSNLQPLWRIDNIRKSNN